MTVWVGIENGNRTVSTDNITVATISVGYDSLVDGSKLSCEIERTYGGARGEGTRGGRERRANFFIGNRLICNTIQKDINVRRAITSIFRNSGTQHGTACNEDVIPIKSVEDALSKLRKGVQELLFVDDRTSS